MTFDPAHFALPFRFTTAPDGTVDAATVPQDSPEEIRNAIEAVLRCPVGFREELPEFGWESPLFSQGPLPTESVTRAVAAWEPRAAIYVAEYGDLTDEAVRRITVEIQEQS